MRALVEAVLRVRWRAFALGSFVAMGAGLVFRARYDELRAAGALFALVVDATWAVGLLSMVFAWIDRQEDRMALWVRLPISLRQTIAVRTLSACVPTLVVALLGTALLVAGKRWGATGALWIPTFVALIMVLANGLLLLWGELGVRYLRVRWVRWILVPLGALLGAVPGALVGVVVTPSVAMAIVSGVVGGALLTVGWSWWLGLHRDDFLRG